MTEKDLFGHTPAQGSFFGAGDDRMSAPQRSDEPDPVVVRKRMRAVLATAKAAHTMPWNDHDARVWQIVFPNMANWLPDEEANQLRFEFAEEMKRLSRAA